jgi:hypothetical protein
VSASTPVGTSKISTASSSTVPTSASCSGLRPTVWILYTEAMVAYSMKHSAKAPLTNR